MKQMYFISILLFFPISIPITNALFILFLNLQYYPCPRCPGITCRSQDEVLRHCLFLCEDAPLKSQAFPLNVQERATLRHFQRVQNINDSSPLNDRQKSGSSAEVYFLSEIMDHPMILPFHWRGFQIKMSHFVFKVALPLNQWLTLTDTVLIGYAWLCRTINFLNVG
jgi:hypothetical protein